MMANIAMHLSCRHKVIFFAVHTLRPGDGRRSILLNNLNRHHLLITSLHNLPPPHSAYPRQLASESSQAQPFLPPSEQLVKPDSRLAPFPLGSSPEFAAHQNGAPQPRP